MRGVQSLEKASMPRAYHNLDGFMRDLRAAKLAGDTRWYELAEEIGEALDAIDGPFDGDDDAPEGQLANTPAALESSDSGVRQQVLPRTGRPAPRSGGVSTPASVLDGLLDGLAGPERESAIAELDKLRRDAVAATGGAQRIRTVRADGTQC